MKTQKITDLCDEAHQLVSVLYALEPELRHREDVWLLISTALQLARRCASQLDTAAVCAAMDRPVAS